MYCMAPFHREYAGVCSSMGLGPLTITCTCNMWFLARFSLSSWENQYFCVPLIPGPNSRCECWTHLPTLRGHTPALCGHTPAYTHTLVDWSLHFDVEIKKRYIIVFWFWWFMMIHDASICWICLMVRLVSLALLMISEKRVIQHDFSPQLSQVTLQHEFLPVGGMRYTNNHMSVDNLCGKNTHRKP